MKAPSLEKAARGFAESGLRLARESRTGRIVKSHPLEGQRLLIVAKREGRPWLYRVFDYDRKEMLLDWAPRRAAEAQIAKLYLEHEWAVVGDLSRLRPVGFYASLTAPAAAGGAA